MIDRIFGIATAIAIMIELGTVLLSFAGLAAIILLSFGVIPAPY